VSRIVVSPFVSLDGVIEDPAGIETLGRGAYDGYAAAWPSRGGEYADKIDSVPKYVVPRPSRTPSGATDRLPHGR
jgi:hypothetical protein